MHRAVQAVARLTVRGPLMATSLQQTAATMQTIQPARFEHHSVSAKRSVVGGIVDFYADDPKVFDQRFIDFFDRPDIDGWMVRQGMQELHGQDMFPEPEIIAAALRACRRVDDHSLAVRFLESIMFKCGNRKQEVYPWLIQEVRSVLDELGVSTPEELGYDVPELYLPSEDYWDWEEYGHGPKPFEDPKVYYN